MVPYLPLWPCAMAMLETNPPMYETMVFRGDPNVAKTVVEIGL